MPVTKAKNEIPTIDCVLVTILRADGTEFGFDTANQISVEPQTEDEEAVKLIVKGILRSQKPETTTLTGHEITLTDNVFDPELVQVLQGGTITYETPDDPSTPIVGYAPPTVGSGTKGEVFTLNAYTAQYDTAGTIVNYECISYPNCTGKPVAFSSEDGVFRAPEYTIISAPKSDESAYTMSWVDALPALANA